MIKKLHILILIFSVSFVQIIAQDSGQLEKWSLGGGIGLIKFNDGHLTYDNTNGVLDGELLSLQLNRRINNYFSIQGEFVTGQFSRARISPHLCDNPYHTELGTGIQINDYDTTQYINQGEQFNTELIEFDLNVLVNVSQLFMSHFLSDNSDNSFNLFVKAGAGINMFRTVRREINSNTFINSYGYEWLWKNEFENAGEVEEKWSNTIHEASFILGLIASYDISERLAVNASIVSRMINTNRLDGVVDNKDIVENDFINNDIFTSYSFGLTYNIGNEMDELILKTKEGLDNFFNSLGGKGGKSPMW